MDNDQLDLERQMREEADARMTNIERPGHDDNKSHTSMRVGDNAGGDFFKDSHYQEKLSTEVDNAIDAYRDIFGNNAVMEIDLRVADGETRADATLAEIDDKIESLSKFEMSTDEVVDVIVDAYKEQYGDFDEKTAADDIKENLRDIKSDSTTDEIDAAIDKLMLARDELSEKIDEVQHRSDKMNNKVDKFEKYENLSFGNLFKQSAAFSVKMQAYKDGVPINGKPVRAVELYVDFQRCLKANIFDSLIELAFSKIEDTIEAKKEQMEKEPPKEGLVDTGVENFKGFTLDDRKEDKIETNRDGISDNGTVTKRMDSADIRDAVDGNPAYGSVAGSPIRSSDAAESYRDKNGVIKENKGNDIQYRITGVERGSPVVGKIIVDTESGAKSIIAADRTVVAVFGGDTERFKTGDKVSSSELDLNINKNKAEAYGIEKFGTGNAVDNVKGVVVENYARSVDTYKDVASKEISCLSEQKATVEENKAFLQEKYESLSDKEKTSEFGQDVKDKIDKSDSYTSKIDERIEKINDYIERADDFKASYNDLKEGKTSISETFDKAISAENAAVSRGARFTTDGTRDNWKDGEMYDGVSALSDKDVREVDNTCDLVDNFDERREDAAEKNTSNDVASSETTENIDNPDSNSQDIENADKTNDDNSDNVESDDKNEPERIFKDDNQEGEKENVESKKDEDAVNNKEVEEGNEKPEDTELDEKKSDNTDSEMSDNVEADNEEYEDTDNTEKDEAEHIDETNDKSVEQTEDDANNEIEKNDSDTQQDTESDNATGDTEKQETGDDAVEQSEERTEHSEEDNVDVDSRAELEDAEKNDDTVSPESEKDVEAGNGEDNDSVDNESGNEKTEATNNPEDSEETIVIDMASFEHGDVEGFSKKDIEGEDIAAISSDMRINQAFNFSVDDYYKETVVDDSEEKQEAPENYFETVDKPADFKEGMILVNNDCDHYSFDNFVDAYKDELSAPDGDEKLLDTFADIASEYKSMTTPDLTYSIAYYDEGGFCKGLDNIEAALEEKGMSKEDIAGIIDSAVESYCNDPICSLQKDNAVVSIEVPITRDREFSVDGENYELHKGDTAHLFIDYNNGNIISDIWGEKTGNAFIPVDHEKGDIIPFACDVLGDVYSKAVGTMSKDVAVLVERLCPNDSKEYILDKIFEHLDDFIEARKADSWDLPDIEEKIANDIKNELNSYESFDVELREDEYRDLINAEEDDNDDDVTT